MGQYKYGKDFVDSNALARHLEKTGKSQVDAAKEFGVEPGTIQSWIARKRIPREVLRKIGGRASPISVSNEPSQPDAFPANASLIVAYVGKANLEAFSSFCSALKIPTKEVL